MTVDHLDPTPLYVQLAGVLRAAIESGQIQPRDPLPSEPTLMQEHGVSRGTVRHAIALLREQGLIVTLPGRGSIVRDKQQPPPPNPG